MAIWRLIIHHDYTKSNDALAWSRREGRIALGWGDVEDVRKFSSEEKLYDELCKIFNGLKNLGAGRRCLWSFCHEMNIGDLVILVSKGEKKNKREWVVEVTGDYEWIPQQITTLGNYQHQRKARVTRHDPDALWKQAGAGPAEGFNMYWALIRCRRNSEAE